MWKGRKRALKEIGRIARERKGQRGNFSFRFFIRPDGGFWIHREF